MDVFEHVVDKVIEIAEEQLSSNALYNLSYPFTQEAWDEKHADLRVKLLTKSIGELFRWLDDVIEQVKENVRSDAYRDGQDSVNHY